MRRAPERFRFYASLPLPDADASVDELERMAGAEACDGVLVPTHVQGASLDDAAFEPLLRALDDRAATVALHPDFFRAPGVLSEWFMDWTIGAPFEDTIAAMRLLSSGRAEQFPRIRWIVPHAGGTLPLMWQRLDNQYEYNRDMIGLDRPPSTYARRFLYDTANQSPATLALAVSEQGADRLLFGTDYPFIGRHDMGYAVRALRECPALGDAEVDAILARGASPP